VSVVRVIFRTNADGHTIWSRIPASIDGRGEVQGVTTKSVVVDALSDLSGKPQEWRRGGVGSGTKEVVR